MGDMTCNPDRADKRGYLKEPFRLFQLRDRDSGAFAYHYHEFHKLILFLSGEVTYRVEGRGYALKGGRPAAHPPPTPSISLSSAAARPMPGQSSGSSPKPWRTRGWSPVLTAAGGRTPICWTGGAMTRKS